MAKVKRYTITTKECSQFNVYADEIAFIGHCIIFKKNDEIIQIIPQENYRVALLDEHGGLVRENE